MEAMSLHTNTPCPLLSSSFAPKSPHPFHNPHHRSLPRPSRAPSSVSTICFAPPSPHRQPHVAFRKWVARLPSEPPAVVAAGAAAGVVALVAARHKAWAVFPLSGVLFLLACAVLRSQIWVGIPRAIRAAGKFITLRLAHESVVFPNALVVVGSQVKNLRMCIDGAVETIREQAWLAFEDELIERDSEACPTSSAVVNGHGKIALNKELYPSNETDNKDVESGLSPSQSPDRYKEIDLVLCEIEKSVCLLNDILAKEHNDRVQNQLTETLASLRGLQSTLSSRIAKSPASSNADSRASGPESQLFSVGMEKGISDAGELVRMSATSSNKGNSKTFLRMPVTDGQDEEHSSNLETANLAAFGGTPVSGRDDFTRKNLVGSRPEIKEGVSNSSSFSASPYGTQSANRLGNLSESDGRPDTSHVSALNASNRYAVMSAASSEDFRLLQVRENDGFAAGEKVSLLGEEDRSWQDQRDILDSLDQCGSFSSRFTNNSTASISGNNHDSQSWKIDKSEDIVAQIKQDEGGKNKSYSSEGQHTGNQHNTDRKRGSTTTMAGELFQELDQGNMPRRLLQEKEDSSDSSNPRYFEVSNNEPPLYILERTVAENSSKAKAGQFALGGRGKAVESLKFTDLPDEEIRSGSKPSARNGNNELYGGHIKNTGDLIGQRMLPSDGKVNIANAYQRNSDKQEVPRSDNEANFANAYQRNSDKQEVPSGSPGRVMDQQDLQRKKSFNPVFNPEVQFGRVSHNLPVYRQKAELEEEFERMMNEGEALLNEGRKGLEGKIEVGAAERMLYESSDLFASAAAGDASSLEAVGSWGNSLLVHGELKLKLSKELQTILPSVDSKSRRMSGEDWRRKDMKQASIEHTLQAIYQECEELLLEAGRKYRMALSIDRNDIRALYNWGLALCFRAQLIMEEGGENAVQDADKVYVKAIDKFEAIMGISQVYAPCALLNWGLALRDRSRLRRMHSNERMKLLQQAKQLFQDALRFDPDYSQARGAVAACSAELKELQEYKEAQFGKDRRRRRGSSQVWD